MRFRHMVPLALAGMMLWSCESARAEEPVQDAAVQQFVAQLGPFVTEYCWDCHSGDEPEAQLNMEPLREAAKISTQFEVLEKMADLLEQRLMPPEDMPQPDEAQRAQLVAAIRAEVERSDCQGERFPGRVTLRRLNRVEYNNTVRDLLGIDFRPADDFPSDDVGEGFDNIGEVLSLSPILVEKYLAAAQQIVEQSLENPEARERIIIARPSQDKTREECALEIIQHFARRAFRRPVSEEEVQRYYELSQSVARQGFDERQQLSVVLQAILVSPYFLFRVEQDPDADDPDGIRQLNDHELASRLSFFLWSSMPDQTLMQLADEGKLQDPQVLHDQVRRMLADPKSEALVQNFGGQWLTLRSLETINPDPQRFPGFDEALRQAMMQETFMLMTAILREDRSVLEFLTADFTFVNQRLAEHYGIDGVQGEQFQRVQLSGPRRGVLTHASILTLTSNPTRTSPVKRGKWVLENFLDAPPPPPPAGVEELDEDGDAELLGTLRERMEQHRSDPNCAVCHLQMDALGFGLENFDAVGAWRQQDGRFEIDAAGTLPGGLDFEGPAQLMTVLEASKRQEFARCLTKKMLTYALGRGLQSYDRCTVKDIVAALEDGDYRFSALVMGIVDSAAFRQRSGKGEQP